MSVEMESPYGGAVIEVHDDLVGRYAEAGWLKKDAGKAPAKKATSAKKSAPEEN